jgi:predicted unusual protein kinase regulating ubiquinone biosynthesis (AarF/ABC1/UbiB family)
MAVRLGGVMIKVGQFLSSRVDVLPAEITAELSGLQDEVPPERFEDIRRVAEEELGLPLEQKYSSFEQTPLAAASLGQVHSARLWLKEDNNTPGRQVNVVVKVQRPNIKNLLDTDLAALRTVGGWLQRYKPIRRRADVPALLKEFSDILYQEIDYLAEGSHAETFAENFAEIPGVRVPRVVWSHTTRRVLTLEDVGGIKITDYSLISDANIDRGEVASRLIDVYLKQIFEDGFFHADPHPGNLFVNPLEDGWELAFVDFGMVGRVPANTRLALREMLMGVGTRDAARVVRSYQMLGLLLPHADLKLIEQAGNRLFENFWGKNMGELKNIDTQEMTRLALEFRELLYTMPFQIPHNIIFLARAVGILSGICSGLDSNFNIWYHLMPYAERLVSEETIGRSPGEWLGELGNLAQRLAKLPLRAEGILEHLERGELNIRDRELMEQVRQVKSSVRSVTASIIFTGMLLAGVQLYIHEAQEFSIVMFGGAVIALLIAFRRR